MRPLSLQYTLRGNSQSSDYLAFDGPLSEDWPHGDDHAARIARDRLRQELGVGDGGAGDVDERRGECRR